MSMAEEKPPWRQFEIRILTECQMSGLTVWQIPTEVRVLQKSSIRVKSHPDFACGILGFALFFDAKVTTKNEWDLKKYCFHEDKLHQYQKLESATETNCMAGYLIHFSNLEKITWVPISFIKDQIKRGVFKVTPEIHGLVSQDSNKPISLKMLLDPEISQKLRIMSNNFK